MIKAMYIIFLHNTHIPLHSVFPIPLVQKLFQKDTDILYLPQYWTCILFLLFILLSYTAVNNNLNLYFLA